MVDFTKPGKYQTRGGTVAHVIGTQFGFIVGFIHIAEEEPIQDSDVTCWNLQGRIGRNESVLDIVAPWEEPKDPLSEQDLLAIAEAPALAAAHDALSDLLEDEDAGNDEIREAAITLCSCLEQYCEKRRAVLARLGLAGA